MAPKIYIPTKSPEDWQEHLARKDKHWKSGKSAWALAHSWQAAAGFPPEIAALFSTSNAPAFQEVEILLAIPEYKVYLPPHPGHASQNDLFVLAKAADGGLISITVEGKVSETFGPTLGGWMKSAGKELRWKFLKEKLGLSTEPSQTVRYQLFHRLASAIIEAEKFNAKYAVMIIQSFSRERVGWDDFSTFVTLFSTRAEVGQLVHLTDLIDISVYTGWVEGKPGFLI